MDWVRDESVYEGVHLHQHPWIGSAQLLAHECEHEPTKLDPPPVQPTMTSGTSPSAASCCMHSSPMTVWWSRMWLSTLPRQFGGGHLHRLGDGDVEAAQAGWVHRQDPPSDLRRLTKDSALPHCPASISVTTFFMPVAALYHTCGTSVFGLCVAE
jgi:hypothetical protein